MYFYLIFVFVCVHAWTYTICTYLYVQLIIIKFLILGAFQERSNLRSRISHALDCTRIASSWLLQFRWINFEFGRPQFSMLSISKGLLFGELV